MTDCLWKSFLPQVKIGSDEFQLRIRTYAERGISKKMFSFAFASGSCVCKQIFSKADRFVQKRRIYYCYPGNKWLSNLLAFSAYWPINWAHVIPLMCATWSNVLTLCVIWVGDWWFRWTGLSIRPRVSNSLGSGVYYRPQTKFGAR